MEKYSFHLIKLPSSQEILVEETATFNLPFGMFKHTDPNAKVTVEATLADGRPLPDWLKFDPSSGCFTATPPEGTGGAMDIKVTARDQKGNVVTSQFLLHITESKSEKPVGPGTDSSDDGTGRKTMRPTRETTPPGRGREGPPPPGPQSDPVKKRAFSTIQMTTLSTGGPLLPNRCFSLGHRKMERDLLMALQKTVSLYRKAA